MGGEKCVSRRLQLFTYGFTDLLIVRSRVLVHGVWSRKRVHATFLPLCERTRSPLSVVVG